jgi:hypothetical protein
VIARASAWTWPAGERSFRAVVAGLACCLIAACASDPFAPPPVNASFVTPELFVLSVSGADRAEAPGLRASFFREVETFARANGCTGYRVLREVFTSSANVNPEVSTDPSIVFGRRPGYQGLVECRLPPLAAAPGPPAVSTPTLLFP